MMTESEAVPEGAIAVGKPVSGVSAPVESMEYAYRFSEFPVTP